MLFFANIVILSLHRAFHTSIFCISATFPMLDAAQIRFSNRKYALYSSIVHLTLHGYAAYAAGVCIMCCTRVRHMQHHTGTACMQHIQRCKIRQILSKSHNKCSKKLQTNVEMLTFVIINAPKAPTRFLQPSHGLPVKHHTNYENLCPRLTYGTITVNCGKTNFSLQLQYIYPSSG